MKSKVDLLDASRMLFAKGYKIYATAGTAAFLNAHGVTTEAVYWPDERPDAENNVMTMIADHAFDLIVNIPKNHTKRELTNGYKIRRGAIDHNINTYALGDYPKTDPRVQYDLNTAGPNNTGRMC